MGAPLRVLVVEDSDADAVLVLRELRRGGYESAVSARVETASEMTDALARQDWDLIVSDYSLPAFSAPAAIALVKATGRDIPLIIVSGTVNEEIAIESLKAGAGDFIAKGKLARLVPAVQRELREWGLRRERATALGALRESEDRYRLVFESNPLPTFVFDVATRAFIDVNEVAISHYGYSRAEFLERKLDDLWPAGASPAQLAELSEMGEAAMRLPRQHKKRDGTLIDVEVATHGFTLGGKRARLAVINDVTARVALEAQLRQAHKMEAIGELAGGIAHDFNNLLAVITSYAELVIDELPAGASIRADIDEIRRAAQRAASLTRQLLAFSRRQVLRPVVVDLNVVVGELERMLRRTIGADIVLSTDLGTALGRVRVDPTQMGQIVLNLAVNARDAMPGGGALTIRTSNETLEDAGGERVVLSVSDTGTGMDAATQARIFEPFFTTKPIGKGTGLGLSTVYGIVKQSDGQVAVESAPGQGTTFTVSLPRVYEPLAGQSDHAVTEEARATETILLVEDDAVLRRVCGRILRSVGYEVLEAGDAESALTVCDAHGSRIAALVTDVVIPHGGGPMLAAEITRRHPQVRVMFMSGYASDGLTHRGIPLGAPFLEKPFTPDSLMRKLRETLQQKALE